MLLLQVVLNFLAVSTMMSLLLQFGLIRQIQRRLFKLWLYLRIFSLESIFAALTVTTRSKSWLCFMSPGVCVCGCYCYFARIDFD